MDLRTMTSRITLGQPATYTKLLIGSNGHHLGNIPAESAYSLQIIRNHAITFKLRESRRSWQQKSAAADTIGLFNLEAPPEIAFDSPFDTIRCFIPRAALLDLADDRGSVDASLNVPPIGTADPFIARLGRTLEQLFDENDDVNQLLIDYLTLSLHSHLLDTYGWNRCQRARSPPKLFEMLQRRAKEALDAQIPKVRSIAEMAQECGLPSVAFMRAFRKATGRFPHQWAMDRRMDLARTRLLHSDEDIASIAATCGFSQPGNFSRAFFRAAGVSPAAWRRAKRMPGLARPALRSARDFSVGRDDSVEGGKSERLRGCMRFEVPILSAANRIESAEIEGIHADDHCYPAARRQDHPWLGNITLKLLPREPDSASSSMVEANTTRNALPKVLLSHDGEQPPEPWNSSLRSTVIVCVDPQVLRSLPCMEYFAADNRFAPQGAGESELTQELIVALIDDCRNTPSCQTRTIGYWAMALCAHLARLHGGLLAPTSMTREQSVRGLSSWQLRQVLDAVNAKLDSRLSLASLAAKCELSVGHFATAFVRSTGIPPHRWITQRRVARAMQLLCAESQSFADIALKCGFADQSHFSRVFSAATGLSPRRWKQSGKLPSGPDLST